MLDALDTKIVNRLVGDGRVTWSELAGQFGLSPPSIADRVKRLEEKGIITGYAACINYTGVGLSITAFVAVTLAHPKYRNGFLKLIESSAEIEECHHITGDDDYLLKVRCRSTQHLDQFLNDHLKMAPGLLRTRTSIALSSPKEKAVRVDA